MIAIGGVTSNFVFVAREGKPNVYEEGKPKVCLQMAIWIVD
jgi:hypothetical protein